MNHERSRSQDKSLSRWENNRIARHKDRVKQIELLKHSPTNKHLFDPSQSNSSSWLWRLDRQNYSRSHFCRGFFWGSIISFTSVFSALLGVALTKIDAVERLVTRTTGIEQSQQPTKSASWDRIDVLWVEFQPKSDRMYQFSGGSVGESKTILLLRFEPNSNSARITNIPLDTKVQIPSYGTGTIADAYKFGGVQLLIQTINRLMNDSAIDRYVSATPTIFQRSFGNEIAVEQCDNSSKKCLNKPQITRQKANFETIRQSLNVPHNLSNFKTAVAEIKPLVDTNLSVPEVMTLANFVKELEPDSISVDLLPGYIPGESIYANNKD